MRTMRSAAFIATLWEDLRDGVEGSSGIRDRWVRIRNQLYWQVSSLRESKEIEIRTNELCGACSPTNSLRTFQAEALAVAELPNLVEVLHTTQVYRLGLISPVHVR